MDKLHKAELPPLFIKPIDPAQLVDIVEMQLNGQMPDVPDATPEGIDSN
jgi:hypothetical protein